MLYLCLCCRLVCVVLVCVVLGWFGLCFVLCVVFVVLCDALCWFGLMCCVCVPSVCLRSVRFPERSPQQLMEMCLFALAWCVGAINF